MVLSVLNIAAATAMAQAVDAVAVSMQPSKNSPETITNVLDTESPLTETTDESPLTESTSSADTVDAYGDPFANEVEQAIKRCNDDYGVGNSKLISEIGAELGKRHGRGDRMPWLLNGANLHALTVDQRRVAALADMPEKAADLQQRLVSGSRRQKTNAVMTFFERLHELRQGRGIVPTFDPFEIAIEQAIENSTQWNSTHGVFDPCLRDGSFWINLTMTCENNGLTVGEPRKMFFDDDLQRALWAGGAVSEKVSAVMEFLARHPESDYPEKTYSLISLAASDPQKLGKIGKASEALLVTELPNTKCEEST